ncbi:hypothetical protein [uncultured Gordonia sp.]|uniref:hypothetical protein n=1 Tax=uncultured Gordonia sp. TaxID=198437 RepID=UPI00258F298E|nr:hypothetical protein [uncultured Gordonia sp.]
MTGYASNLFRHNCSTKGCYYDTLPDWSWMNEVFPRGIMPTDIDGMVEMNSRFLFIEQKQPGVGLKSGGQGVAMRRLSRLPGVTVVLFRPAPGTPGGYEYLFLVDGKGSGWIQCSIEDFKTWLRLWCDYAQSAPAA